MWVCYVFSLSSFPQNFFQIISNLLEEENKEKWEDAQKVSIWQCIVNNSGLCMNVVCLKKNLKDCLLLLYLNSRYKGKLGWCWYNVILTHIIVRGHLAGVTSGLIWKASSTKLHLVAAALPQRLSKHYHCRTHFLLLTHCLTQLIQIMATSVIGQLLKLNFIIETNG